MSCLTNATFLKVPGDKHGFCGKCHDSCEQGKCVNPTDTGCKKCAAGSSLVKAEGKTYGTCLKCPNLCRTCSAAEADEVRVGALRKQVFSAKLGVKNGVEGRMYWFLPVEVQTTSGSFSSVMIDGCNKYGMKPMCDKNSYCKTDPNSIYIGQSHHVAHTPHRNNNGFFPSGWSAIKNKWDSTCTYTAKANGGKLALCNEGGGHGWRTPAYAKSANLKIMCISLEDPTIANACTRCMSGFVLMKTSLDSQDASCFDKKLFGGPVPSGAASGAGSDCSGVEAAKSNSTSSLLRIASQLNSSILACERSLVESLGENEQSASPEPKDTVMKQLLEPSCKTSLKKLRSEVSTARSLHLSKLCTQSLHDDLVYEARMLKEDALREAEQIKNEAERIANATIAEAQGIKERAAKDEANMKSKIQTRMAAEEKRLIAEANKTVQSPIIEWHRSHGNPVFASEASVFSSNCFQLSCL